MKVKTIKLKDLSSLQSIIDDKNRWIENITNIKNYKTWNLSTSEQHKISAEKFINRSFYGSLPSNIFFNSII
jgi:hypothetical protein